MKAKIYSTEGKNLGNVELPDCFNEEYRPDLIKRAVLAEQSRERQPYGTDPKAGTRTSAESWGVGGGISRIPRIKVGPRRSGREARGHEFRSKGRWFPRAMEGAFIPGVRGGRRAHPPKVAKVISKKINKKEYSKALKSAIAATIDSNLIKARGHNLDKVGELPLVMDDKIAEIKKTKDILMALNSIGLEADLNRAGVRKVRAGRGKSRGRKYKQRKGPLVVVQSGTGKTTNNIIGVDMRAVNKLKVSDLAPGTNPGRLTVWTKGAIEELKVRFK